MYRSNYSYEILSKTFSDKVSKKAYLEASKWLAINVYSKPIASEVSTKIEKEKGSKIPTFKVTIYVDISCDKAKEDFCGKCKSLHSTFYSIDKINCVECKMNAFFKNVNKNSEGIIDFVKRVVEDNE